MKASRLLTLRLFALIGIVVIFFVTAAPGFGIGTSTHHKGGGSSSHTTPPRRTSTPPSTPPNPYQVTQTCSAATCLTTYSAKIPPAHLPTYCSWDTAGAGYGGASVWSCKSIRPPSTTTQQFSFGMVGNPATMSYNTWTINYGGQSYTYPFYPTSISGEIEAVCDGAPVTGSITYNFTPPSPASYRNPPAGWNWVTPPPAPPALTYSAGTFTTPPCSPYRQAKLTGVSLQPSPQASKAPTVGNGQKIIANGNFHTFYFRPTPVCPAGHPNCGVDTTLIWRGGTATMGIQSDPHGNNYSSWFYGLGGSHMPRWELYPGSWHPGNESPSLLRWDTHYLYNVPACGTSSNAPSGSSFEEPCVSVSLHAPSTYGNPIQLSISGEYEAVWSHWYFNVTLQVPVSMTTSTLTAWKWVKVYHSRTYCSKEGKHGCISWGRSYWTTQYRVTEPVTWLQPTLSVFHVGVSPFTPSGGGSEVFQVQQSAPAHLAVVAYQLDGTGVY